MRGMLYARQEMRGKRCEGVYVVYCRGRQREVCRGRLREAEGGGGTCVQRPAVNEWWTKNPSK